MSFPDNNRRNMLKSGIGALGALGVLGTGVSISQLSHARTKEESGEKASLYISKVDKDSVAARGISGLSGIPESDVRALRRLAFGYKPEDRDYFESLGTNFDDRLKNYVNEQLDGYQPGHPPKNDPLLTTILNDPLTAWETLGDSLETQWQERALFNDDAVISHLPRLETEVLAILNAVYGRWQLAEILADFWHTHFSVDGSVHEAASTFVQYDRDVIRPNLLGNFRQMLESVTKSTAMMYYLNNISNSKFGPNENYAREVQELHTLGALNSFGFKLENEIPNASAMPGSSTVLPVGLKAGYSEEDVRQVTLCLTGWTISSERTDGLNTGAFVYLSDWHDDSAKRVLGIDIAATGEDEVPEVWDLLAMHPNTARYVCTKLCRRFINDDPPQAIIEKAAIVFNDQWQAQDQLKQVVRTILLSDEFKDAANWGSKVKRPFESIVGTARSCGGFTAKFGIHDYSIGWEENSIKGEDFLFSQSFVGNIYETQSMPFSWITPDGMPDRKEDWLASTPLLKCWHLINQMFMTWRIDYGNTEEYYHFFPVDAVSVTKLALSEDQRTPAKIVDFWIHRLLGFDQEKTGTSKFSEITRNKLISFMQQDAEAAEVILDLNEDVYDGQAWNEHVPERVQTLVASIAMLPENLLR